MFTPINENKKTFYNKVVEHIRELIDTGKLQPGDKLPPERELAEMMKVSRPTIREALKLLSAMGYLNIQHGNGVFVAQYIERIDNLASLLFMQSDKVSELFEVRKTLETQTAAWAAVRGKAILLRQIARKTKEVYEQIMEKNNFSTQEERDEFLSISDQEFHLSVAEAAGNEVVLRVMVNLIDLLKASRMQSMKIPGRVEQSLREHMLIADALVEHNSESARQLMLNHLNGVEQDLLRELNRHKTTRKKNK
ncbi:MAG TPA: FadR/GntR family transcriptional regulator [Bacilli bacterium]